MKKQQYIQPQTNVVLLKTGLSMLAGSINSNSIDLDEIMGEGDGGDAASRRRRSVWDDEDEEDDW